MLEMYMYLLSPGLSPGRVDCVVFFPLSTQEYKWVLANCQGNLTKYQGVTWHWTTVPPRGSFVAILLVGFMLQKPGQALAVWASLGPNGFTFTYLSEMHYQI